jgi:hypothetical protein
VYLELKVVRTLRDEVGKVTLVQIVLSEHYPYLLGFFSAVEINATVAIALVD